MSSGSPKEQRTKIEDLPVVFRVEGDHSIAEVQRALAKKMKCIKPSEYPDLFKVKDDAS